MSLRKLHNPAAFQRPDGYTWDTPPAALSEWTERPLAAEGDDPNTVSIYGVIGEDFWTGEGFTAKRMAGALRSIGRNAVTVNINSPGGDMFEGLAIYNLLREHPAEVTVKVMGIAASAASIIAIHCDSELMQTIAIKFDDVVIAKDGSGRVTTEEFIAEESGWFGFNSRKPFFSHWLRSFTPDNPAPAMPAAFTAAFPEWTTAHRLAGVTVSIVRIDPVADDKDIGGVYRWRGAIGLGEPAVSIIGVWSRIRDPRNLSHLPNAPSTWGQSTNLALIAAWHRSRRQGFNMDNADINWVLVADAADKCDVLITDRYDVQAPLYAGGGTWDEARENIAVETDILAGCDGQTMFDSEGRWYPKVGFWEEPTLTLTAARDIFSMSDSEATDGEAAVDGVIVEYKEPDLGYVMQPCAPWKNPNFYVEGREPRYLTIKVPVCKNHRQAVNLAKAFGRRLQPTMRIAPQTGLRGRRAKRERIIALDYDETIAGNWQVAAPVQLDSAGVSALLMLVPAYPDNWTLLGGEEGEKPTGQSVEIDTSIPVPTGVVLLTDTITVSSGLAAQLKATFDAPARIGDIVEFQYRPMGETVWLGMDTIPEQAIAYSPVVSDGLTYQVQYRVRRGSRSTEWSSPPLDIIAATDSTMPGPVTDVSADASISGEVTFGWTAPASANYAAARIYIGLTSDPTLAILVRTEPGVPSAADSYVRTGMAADTYYGWIACSLPSHRARRS